MVKVHWSKKENDFLIHYDKSPNGGFVNDHLLNKEFLNELKNRGFDLKTLRFSIKKSNEAT